ncbi:hypothetical protein [uncultured Aquimarina sp.]|uniref:hypothetical protein n=1 Tax=uncultured Aquimarina sp. TaxID=575652 RepID=UPI00262EBD02|nr:hypothetical protein [uncultured Aquimarina sp.]
MSYILSSLVPFFRKNPKLLFLVDGIGALLTLMFLSIVLPAIRQFIGIPLKALYFLAIIAIVLLLYSTVCFFLNPLKYEFFVKIIAVANLIYCFITVGTVIFYYDQMTLWGFFYFGLETFIILILVALELLVGSDRRTL